MKRPSQKSRYPDKPKSLDRNVPPAFLIRWAETAAYESSDYHCYGPNGRPPKPRAKPAMPCPRDWTKQQGLNAVRTAIRAGQVSKAKVLNGFPRHIWHCEGDVWYEGRTNDGWPGVYHGHPVEPSALPSGLIR